jgi:hypothetical protein
MTDVLIIAIASACLGTSCFLFGVWVGRGEPAQKQSDRQPQQDRTP